MLLCTILYMYTVHVLVCYKTYNVHCRIVEHKSDARSDWKSVYKINDKVSCDMFWSAMLLLFCRFAVLQSTLLNLSPLGYSLRPKTSLCFRYTVHVYYYIV